jgi:Dihaem cytochrome c
MSNYQNHLMRMVAVVGLVMCGGLSQAQAEEGGWFGDKYGGENRGKPVQPPQVNAKFQQECSGCHVAYAPGLLPVESWRKVMAGLDKDNKEITAFLVNNASNRWKAQTAPLRITESGWFKRKHDSHEVDPAVWKRPSVKSPANCGACHPQAERGDFSERNIRIPK